MPNLIEEIPVATTTIDGTEQLYGVQSNTTDIRFASGLFGFVMGLANRVINLLTGANVASAATINLNTTTGNRVHITGTTTITAVTLTRGPRTLIFDGILTLTHHATNNNLPGAANITTAAGDRAVYESDGTTVYCVAYIRAAAQPIAPYGTGVATALGINIGSAGAFVTFNGALGTPSSGTLTNASGLPAAGVVNTAATLTDTQTLTNKRVTPRVGTTTSSATPTINTDNVDMYTLTAQAVDITSFTSNLSGTPTNGQGLIIQITGTATRAITWGASFEASTVPLPTATVSTNLLSVGFLWNSTTSKWRVIGAC